MNESSDLTMPPGMSKAIEKTAQRILDCLPKENSVENYIALVVARISYVIHTPFSDEQLERLFGGRRMEPPLFSDWEDLEADYWRMIVRSAERLLFSVEPEGGEECPAVS